MNNFLKYFLTLLPVIIKGIEDTAKDLAGHQKKQLAKDIMTDIAAGVAQVNPENGALASQAATIAGTTIDGIVAMVKAPAMTTQEQAAATIAQ